MIDMETAKHVLGWTLLALPFIAIAVAGIKILGRLETLVAFVVAFTTFGIIQLGGYLLK